MRRVSANYIIPVSSPPLKNGIIECDDSGTITSVIDTGGDLKEMSRLEFFNGLLVPGFINPYCRIEPFIFEKSGKNNTRPEEFVPVESPEILNDRQINTRFSEMEKFLRKTGIRGMGSVSSHNHFFQNKSTGEIIYHSFIEVRRQKDRESFELFNSAVDEIMTGWNDYNLMCSLIPYNFYEDEDLTSLVTEFALTHKNPIILKCPEKSTSAELLLIEFSKVLAHISGESFDITIKKFNNPIIVPVDISTTELRPELEDDIFFLLSSEDNQLPGSCFRGKIDQKKYLDHLLFSSYESGFHTNYPVITELITLQFKIPWLLIDELIRFFTITPARALNMDHRLGSFEPGKTPGINLITHIDFKEMKMTERSELKVIV